MTLVTGTVQDLGYDGMEGTLWARPARFRSDGSVVYAPERKPFPINSGVVSAELAPGPAVLEIQVGSHARGTFEVVIPEEDISLADLLDTVFPWEPAQVSQFVAERERAEKAKSDAVTAAGAAETAAGTATTAAQQTGQDRTHVDQVRTELDEAFDASTAGNVLPPRLTEAALNATYGRSVSVSPAATPAATTTSLVAALAEAVSQGVPLVMVGEFHPDATVPIPAGSRIVGKGATLHQPSALTPALAVDASNVSIESLTLQGITTDYSNTGGVDAYQSCGIRVGSGAGRVSVRDCRIVGFAGAGINVHNGGEALVFDGNYIEGPGAAYITGTSHQYASAIRIVATSNWRVSGNEMLGYAQGVFTTVGVSDFHITDNHIHDIPGQHGLYIGTAQRAVITGNRIERTGILGMKIQSSSGNRDAKDVLISGNIFTDIGGDGILLTNTGASAGDLGRLYRIVVSNNIVTNAGGDGVQASWVRDCVISDNHFTATRNGVRVTEGDGLVVRGNAIRDCTTTGLDLASAGRPITNVVIDSNHVLHPGRRALYIGSSATELVVSRNIFVAVIGGSAVYVETSAAINTTTSFIDNLLSGEGSYGFRIGPTGALRQWVGNVVTGTWTESDVLNSPSPRVFTAAATGTINSGDATTDTIIANLRTRVAELEAVIKAAKWVA